MMNGSESLRELYQTTILEHGRHPRNFRVLPQPDGQAHGYNPLCGDEVNVSFVFEGDQIRDIAFQGKGCAISMASASLMTEAVRNLSAAQIQKLFHRFQEALTQKEEPNAATLQGPLGKLEILMGVRAFPARVKCATLAWHTLIQALSTPHLPPDTEQNSDEKND